MNDFNYLTRNEIAVKSYANMVSIMEALIQENYVVMVSREENLYIINYVWSPNCNRNDICFTSRELVEDFIFNPPSEDNNINCKTTKCENCTNHNYCDFESQERSDKE